MNRKAISFTKRCMAVLLAVSAASAGLVTANAENETQSMDGVISALHQSDVTYYQREMMNSYFDYIGVKSQTAVDKNHQGQLDVVLPEKFDLRNVDGKCYVSSVKNQNPWGLCWSFGSLAAAETTLAFANGYDYNNPDPSQAMKYDLSEKHLGWFMYTPLPANNKLYPSQAGEGMFSDRYSEDLNNADKSEAVYNTGGYSAAATTLFSAGIGPVSEERIPFEGKDKELYNSEYTFFLVILMITVTFCQIHIILSPMKQ